MSETQFKPAWWLRNSHLQTIWPAVCRRPIKDLPLQRERIELPDGDFIDLDWVKGNDTGPVVLLLHGLEGSIESHYAKGLLKSISDRGWRGVFMHFRGCSGEPNRLPRGYHSGETGDLQYIVRILQERVQGQPISAIGVSLGGNVLLKWLGESGPHNPLAAAIAVSVPFELQKAATKIQYGFSRFYQWYFIRCLCDRLTQKHRNDPAAIVDLNAMNRIETMYDFDDKITAPLHGFSGVDEYYATASSRQYLNAIRVPTLILHAKDDPFMTEDIIPEPHELSPFVTLELSENGGHVGFVSGKYPWKPEYWLEQRAPSFLAKHFK